MVPDEAKAHNDLAIKPFDAFFESQARRIYSPYQAAEEMAWALRDWIDRMFDPNLQRTPVIPTVESEEADG